MIPPIKRGTARRLGIRQPCPCMAVPQRIMLGFDAGPAMSADAFVAAIQNGRIIHTSSLAEHVRKARCPGNCRAAP